MHAFTSRGFDSVSWAFLFNERLTNRWNRLPDSVDFTLLIRVKRSLDTIEIIDYTT